MLSNEKGRAFANVAQKFVMDLPGGYNFGLLGRYRLPYQDCILMVNGGHGTQMLYCVSEDARGIAGGASIYFDGKYWGSSQICVLEDGQSLALFPKDLCGGEVIDVGEPENNWVVGPLIRFLDVLSAPSTKLAVSEVSTSVNAKRQRKGKFPLVEYKTVVIDKRVDAQLSSQCGGTHASPRLHLRRGHWRSLPNRAVWIKPAVVGDKRLGLVLKDYEVRP
jgi:hypothetical protein